MWFEVFYVLLNLSEFSISPHAHNKNKKKQPATCFQRKNKTEGIINVFKDVYDESINETAFLKEQDKINICSFFTRVGISGELTQNLMRIRSLVHSLSLALLFSAKAADFLASCQPSCRRHSAIITRIDHQILRANLQRMTRRGLSPSPWQSYRLFL